MDKGKAKGMPTAAQIVTTLMEHEKALQSLIPQWVDEGSKIFVDTRLRKGFPSKTSSQDELSYCRKGSLRRICSFVRWEKGRIGI